MIQRAPNCPHHNTFCDFLPSRILRHTNFVRVPDTKLPSHSVVLSTGWGSCGNSKHKRQIEACINYLGAAALGIVIITDDAFQKGHISVLRGLLAASPALPWLRPSEPIERKYKCFDPSGNPHFTEGDVPSSLTQCGT